MDSVQGGRLPLGRRRRLLGRRRRFNDRDGGGLYLRIVDRERRWWVFHYGAGGKRYHGLGPAHIISLAEAREQAPQRDDRHRARLAMMSACRRSFISAR
jgi:hypothetical protein